MADKGTRFKRIAKWTLIAIAILLAIPPLQILLAKFRNPPGSPMQWQRKIEFRAEGKKIESRPIEWVPLDRIPVEFIHYVWSSEDQGFFKHDGFDLAEMKKAVAEAKKSGKSVRGSSTITMQCARSVFLWQGRSWLRKGIEAYYTVWMELLLSKQRILELYLNHIELGPGIYGIGAASEKYFDRQPEKLTPRQMIALAAILPNPLKWSPVNPDETVRKKIRRIERLSGRAPFPEKELK